LYGGCGLGTVYFLLLFNDDKLVVPLFIAEGQGTAHPRVLPPFAYG
jgi:hypothetical protein